jgi:hypothetical protein
MQKISGAIVNPMSKKKLLTWAVAGLGVLGAGTSLPVSTAKADDHSQKLAAVVTRLNDWIVDAPDAERWRAFLDLNAVETVTGRGYRADIADLNQAAARFASAHSSLRHPNFQTVHIALLEQARRIEAANARFPEATYSTSDLAAWKSAFADAAKNLQPFSASQANAKRLLLLVEVQALQKYIIERGPGFTNYVKPPSVLAVIDPDMQAKDPAIIHAEQLEQLTRLIQWLQVPVSFPWENTNAGNARNAGNTVGAVGQISDQGTALAYRIGDHVDEVLGEDSKNQIQRVAFQDVPADPSLNDVLAGLRQQQLWLQKNSRLDPNPYMGYTVWLLNDYMVALNLGRRENMTQVLARQIDNLVAALDEWLPSGDRNKQAEVGRILGLLDGVDQAPELITAFKRTFYRNNAAVYVGESLVNQLASRPVNETQPVYEVILDNEVYGTATTNGQVRIDFVPDDRQAHISIQLRGVVNSDNYTPAGPVTAFTGSQADVEARRSIFLNVGGFYQQAPYGAANLQSYFKGTSCGRIVDRLAESQFSNQQAGAEAIGARRAETRLVRQFEQETSTALGNGRSDLQQRRQEAGLLRSVRPTAYLITDENFLQVYAKKIAGSQTLALNAPPSIVTPSDLAFQLHESFLSNFLEDAVGGRVLTHEDVARVEAELKKDAVAAGGQITDDSPANREAFELTFATARPIEVRFDDQMINVVLNIRNFKAQGQSINDVQVLIRLKLHFDAADTSTIRLAQVGTIRASLLDPDKIDLNTATVLDLIENTLNREISLQRERAGTTAGAALPANLIDRQWLADVQDPQIARLVETARLATIRFEHGWATLAWTTGSASASAPQDLSAITDAAGFAELTRNAQAEQE